MNVNIPSDLNPFVQQMISSGGYRDENEVVVEGLRLLRSREQLRADVDAGIAELEAGRSVDGNDVFRRLLDRAKTFETREAK